MAGKLRRTHKKRGLALEQGIPLSDFNRNMVTQAQIAEKLGVSRQLVTFALGDYPQVSSKSRRILRANVGPVPTEKTGTLVAICLAVFIAFFAAGPGVCVWLALSELMPTRIHSIGMGVALLPNQGVSAGIAALFLPIVVNYGHFEGKKTN